MSQSRCSILFLALLGSMTCPALADEPRPPNIVLIFVDDMGYADIGPFGASMIRTPNLDRMAAEGAKLTEFYACAPVCTPSRAGLLTGRYPIRSGLTHVLFPQSRGGIEDGEVTLAELLHSQGYATMCIGKWHLGHLPPYLPTRHGFDHYFGIPYSNDMLLTKRGDPPLPLMRDTKIIEQPADQDTLTMRYTEEAIRFLQASKDRPFFLYLPHSMVHIPLAASKAFRGKSPRGLYGDAVEEIDWSTGEILRTLKELGLDEQTLVIFTSDNGPWLIKKENGGSAGPLRDGKGTTYEGGMREPFLARWPGRIPAGRTCAEPAMNIDLLPTLVHLAGGAVPDDRPIDGRDILGLLTGDGHRDGHDFYYYSDTQLQAVRSGNWKLHLPIRIKRKDKVVDRPAALYDLEADPGKSNDLIDAHPETVARLTAQARAFDAEARRGASSLKR